MDIKIIDCTIRDGGHLNKWNFDPLCVKTSYFAALNSGVQYFEIGYRYPETITGLGNFAYCTDEFLTSIFKASKKCKLTVMIDAGKCNSSQFKECKETNTPIMAVRVAAYPYEIEKAIKTVEELKEKGYEVFLNIMAYSELEADHFEILKNWQNKNILESINFADSFGSFIPTDIPALVKKLKDVGYEKIGFHSHNNLQMAFANSLRAIEEGASFIDASIFGMGRGSGNLPIEIILGYLEKNGNARYNTVAYIDVIERFYLEIFKQLNWGYKLQSLIGGLKNIHPYYVDDLFKKNIYTIDEIWTASDLIKENCPISYSSNKMNEILNEMFFNPSPEPQIICQNITEKFQIIPSQDAFKNNNLDVANKHKGKPFLIIASGPSILTHKDNIDNFIKKENCITIGMNYMRDFFVPDYQIFISKKRFLKYFSTINEKSTLLVPSFFGKELIEKNYSNKYSYFDVEIVDDPSIPSITEYSQNCLHPSVSISAILMAYQMGASEIFVAGMDGYVNEKTNELNYFYNEQDIPEDKQSWTYMYEKQVVQLKRVSEFLHEQSVPLSIITPTTHKKYYRNFFHAEELNTCT
ncbi:MAG: 6-hydroxymethylpterin diphosphokinase MptE-like protein [bacterium]